MNLAFWILVLLGLFSLWCEMSPRFRTVGKGLTDKAKEIKDIMSKENEDTEGEE